MLKQLSTTCGIGTLTLCLAGSPGAALDIGQALSTAPNVSGATLGKTVTVATGVRVVKPVAILVLTPSGLVRVAST